MASALYGRSAPPLLSFIAGLGGRAVRSVELDQMVAALHRAADDGGSALPHLLYTQGEYEQMRAMLRTAGHDMERS